MRLAMLQDTATVLDGDANISLIAHAAEQAAKAEADLLLTPELFISGYAPEQILQRLVPEQAAAWGQRMPEVARAAGIAIAYCLPEYVDGQWMIVGYVVDRNGAQLARYVKVHLYGPEEQRVFKPGTGAPALFELEGLRIGLMICFDVEFPETVRAAAVRGAELVIVPTALSVGNDPVTDSLIPARAMENGVYVAYANHSGMEAGLELSGHSVVAAPSGTVLAAAGAEAELLITDLAARQVSDAQRITPYLAELRNDLYQRWGAETRAD